MGEEAMRRMGQTREKSWNLIREQLEALRRAGLSTVERATLIEREALRLEQGSGDGDGLPGDWWETQRVLVELFRQDPVAYGQVRVFAEMQHRVASERAHPSSAVLGETNGAAKLSEPTVRDIRRRNRLGESITSLARDYGVCRDTIKDAVQRRTWRHIP